MKTRDEVRALFTLAGIKILDMWKLQNEYWGGSDEPPEDYYELIIKNPWWLVKTEKGLVKIGPRKRVFNIEWEDTKIQKILTEDDVTKNVYMVHAWGMLKVQEYLNAPGEEINRVEEHLLRYTTDKEPV